MAYEYQYFKDQKDQAGTPDTWDELIQRSMDAILDLVKYRHSHYSPGDIPNMGTSGIMLEVERKLGRVREYYDVQKANEVYRRHGWPIPEAAEQDVVDEKFTDSIADAISYLLFLLVLHEPNINGKLAWYLPMGPTTKVDLRDNSWSASTGTFEIATNAIEYALNINIQEDDDGA